jgi:DNA-binding MarR family transcriptional regulator
VSALTRTPSRASPAGARRRAAGAPVTPEPRLSYLVKQLELAIRAEMDAHARAAGLTALQYTALTVLQRQPGMSGAQLSRRSFVSPQAGSEMLGHLERKGLIARAPDPDNRRVLRVRLTEEGERTVDDCDRWMDGIEARMLAGIPAAERRALRATLAACEHSLRPPD